VPRRDLHLPAGYTENPVEAVGGQPDDAGYWSNPTENRLRRARRYQDAVYRYAARLPLTPGSVVLDVGCGTGLNLATHFSGRPVHTVGIDQPSAIALAQAEFPDREWIAADLREDAPWHDLRERGPALVICADVVEHVDDPVLLLQRLRRLVAPVGRVVLSTPDRERMEDQPVLGPPRNPHHVREWSHAEMRALLESSGFRIVRSRHVLPRRFGWNLLDAKIIVWRALHGRAVPARRSCMVFELFPT